MRKDKSTVFNELISERNAKRHKSNSIRSVMSFTSIVLTVGIVMSAVIVLPSVLSKHDNISGSHSNTPGRFSETDDATDSEIKRDPGTCPIAFSGVDMDGATFRYFAKNYSRIVWADYKESDLISFNRITYKDILPQSESCIPNCIDTGFIVDETDELYAYVLVPYVVADNTAETKELTVDGEDLQLSVSGENLKRVYMQPMLGAKGIKYFEVNGVTVALLTATELNNFYENGKFSNYEDYLYMVNNVKFNIFLDKAPYDLNPFYDPDPFSSYTAFNGKIVEEISGVTLLVESVEPNIYGMMPKGTDTYIHRKDVDLCGLEHDLTVGDSVCVVFKGLVMESAPVQIDMKYVFYTECEHEWEIVESRDKPDYRDECEHDWKLIESRDKPYYREYVCTKCGMGKIEME